MNQTIYYSATYNWMLGESRTTTVKYPFDSREKLREWMGEAVDGIYLRPVLIIKVKIKK